MASITVTFKIQIYNISEFVAIKMDTAAVCNEYATHQERSNSTRKSLESQILRKHELLNVEDRQLAVKVTTELFWIHQNSGNINQKQKKLSLPPCFCLFYFV